MNSDGRCPVRGTRQALAATETVVALNADGRNTLAIWVVADK